MQFSLTAEVLIALWLILKVCVWVSVDAQGPGLWWTILADGDTEEKLIMSYEIAGKCFQVVDRAHEAFSISQQNCALLPSGKKFKDSTRLLFGSDIIWNKFIQRHCRDIVGDDAV